MSVGRQTQESSESFLSEISQKMLLTKPLLPENLSELISFHKIDYPFGKITRAFLTNPCRIDHPIFLWLLP